MGGKIVTTTTTWTRFAILAIALSTSAAQLAGAQEPTKECELKSPLQVTAKPKGKGKKTTLKRGTKVGFTVTTGAWIPVLLDSGEGYAAAKAFKKSCVPIAKPPPPKEEPERAAKEPPPGAPTDNGEPPPPSTPAAEQEEERGGKVY